jgi:hypothetical protein
MKIIHSILLNIILVTVFVASFLFVNTAANTSKYETTSLSEYDPWVDLDDDGDVDLYDAVRLLAIYGTKGNPITKASITYDSGWTDITNKAGQYFNITHNLNNTDIIVDITGRTMIECGTHQRQLGLTRYTPGWSSNLGGPAIETAYSAVYTDDGGYAIAGVNCSGNNNFALVKAGPVGNFQWSKTYGGSGSDYAECVITTEDGGYALAGGTSSYGQGKEDCWLVKTDSNGNLQWNKTYGGENVEKAFSMVQTPDGGYAIAGFTESIGTNRDFWLVKTGVESGLIWTDSTADTVTLYRGATDAYWNYVRVRIWKIKETP